MTEGCPGCEEFKERLQRKASAHSHLKAQFEVRRSVLREQIDDAKKDTKIEKIKHTRTKRRMTELNKEIRALKTNIKELTYQLSEARELLRFREEVN